ncbi:PREDICTED: F-box/WD repeat-containing protein 10-like, partial [Apaloderma vittatum]|uniref:F-box/WD repeat-containing protein 10-like n=1 Tax=Apaloderma vittatum TaxID=57397 RepID=UPI0005214FCC
ELCPRGVVVNYAKTVDVTIPQLNEEGDVVEEQSHKWQGNKKEEGNNLQAAYHGLKTNTILLEERNVFCGSYNIHILMDQSDRSRKVHYSGGNLVAIGSVDHNVRLLDMSRMKEMPLLLSGHAGSVKALFLDEKRGFVLSGSFDLSIRCWDIHSGACVKIFNGHCGTITCLDLHKEQFVSGGRDGLVKVWNLVSGKCLKTLKHRGVVQTVKMNGTHVVSGSDQGLVKIWCAATGTLVKILEGHQGPVKCLCFDRWHLVTGSTDGYVLAWSMLGNLKRCLIAFHHPKKVLSLEFLCLRVISGCADGKIRIFNFLTGSCLRVLLASSSGNPISSFYVAGNRMVVNSPTTLLMFQFEEIKWDYTLGADREMMGKKNWCKRTCRRAELHPCRLAREVQDADQLELPCWTCRCSPKSCGTSPEDQAVQLQQVSLYSDSLTMKRISVPFETKMLRFKLKNSLHGPAVNSSIPAPAVMRPKTCGLPRQKEAGGGRDPSRGDSRFKLLMGKWKEEYEAAPAAQYWAHQVKLREDQQKARKKAWLRKSKGLPTDSFTEEGKTPAPELGFNTFI